MSLPALLLPLAAHPTDTAVLVDFDGSISAIVDDPAAARVLPAARDALAALIEVMATVAVVSGRPVGFLARAIDVPGLTLVGQYGLERMVDGNALVDARAEPYLEAIAAAADDVERELPDLLVERKAGVAVTVHWRTIPEREDHAVEVVDRLARRRGLTVYPTKMARELRPPVPADKGTAVEALLEGSRHACFAGDDRGDLDAFAALARLASSGRLDDAVRIAVGSAEAPPELVAQADLVVHGPAGLVSVLDELARAATRTPR
ncbi:MAG TPA: trehalose-phosphatase [Acidimicrobiia bacterium]|nr:trehalose-phosphatase [Acidimicrobiia bacterium]